jgi:hypothetical protein
VASGGPAFTMHLPARSIFRKFQVEGVWEAIWAELQMALRERIGREASPSAAVLDSHSVKSTEKAAVKTTSGVRRRQEGEEPQSPRPGRQRRDANAGVVHSAIQDRDGPGLVLDRHDGNFRDSNSSAPMAATTPGRLTRRRGRCRCCA